MPWDANRGIHNTVECLCYSYFRYICSFFLYMFELIVLEVNHGISSIVERLFYTCLL